MSQPLRRLLVLDDEPLSRGLVESVVAPDGFAVRATSDPRDAVAWARQNTLGVLLVDIMMGAIEAVPRLCGSRLNSALRSGLSEPL